MEARIWVIPAPTPRRKGTKGWCTKGPKAMNT